MTPEQSAAELAAVLLRLAAGDRAWFWSCPALSRTEGPLGLLPVAEDPDMEAFAERVAELAPPGGEAVAIGVATVDADGVLELGAAELGAHHLPPLARFAAAHVEALPGLGRLRYLRLARLGDGGRVVQRFDDPLLWTELPAVAAPGTLDAAEEALEALAAGEEAWVWLSEQGPGDEPFAALVPVAADPEGAAFASLVRNLVLRSPEDSAGRSAVVRRLESGRLVFRGEEPAALERAVLAVARAHGEARPAFAALRDARVLEVLGGTA